MKILKSHQTQNLRQSIQENLSVSKGSVKY